MTTETRVVHDVFIGRETARRPIRAERGELARALVDEVSRVISIEILGPAFARANKF